MVTTSPNLSPERWHALVSWYGDFVTRGGQMAVLHGRLSYTGPDWLLTSAVRQALDAYQAALVTRLCQADDPAVGWRLTAMLGILAHHPRTLNLVARPGLIAAPGTCRSCGEPAPVITRPPTRGRCLACTAALQLALRRVREGDLS